MQDRYLRVAARAALFVGLGAGVNVGLAWWSAMCVDARALGGMTKQGFSSPENPGWDVQVWERFVTTIVRRRPIRRIEAMQLENVAPYWSTVSRAPAFDEIVSETGWSANVELNGAPMLYEEARGWPKETGDRPKTTAGRFQHPRINA